MTTAVIGENTGDDYSGTADNRILSTVPTANLENETFLNLSNYSVTPVVANLLLKFTGLSNISGPVTVSSATVGLYQTVDQYTGRNLSFYRVLRDWVVNQITWNIWATSNNWTTAGCLSDGNDKSATLTGAMSISGTTKYQTLSTAQLITDVENFINGSLSNYGWNCIVDPQSDTSINNEQFRSQASTDGQRPYLSVTYTAAGGTIPQAMYHYMHNTGSGL